jgi:hypothetical protein
MVDRCKRRAREVLSSCWSLVRVGTVAAELGYRREAVQGKGVRMMIGVISEQRRSPPHVQADACYRPQTCLLARICRLDQPPHPLCD